MADGHATARQIVICRVPCYNIRIVIKHKGLRVFFERGDARRLPVAIAPRIRRILRTWTPRCYRGTWTFQATACTR